jgi:Xaa-Pro aminopeptidase
MPAVTVPTRPDLGRMQRDRWAKLREVMGAQGVDALVLLGNSNVSYATGAGWALSDPGRANVERPVAVVTAGGEPPHLFTPFPEWAAGELGLPEDHVHGPAYLEFDEGAADFGRALAGLVPTTGTGKVAVDELPGSLRRAQDLVFPKGPPSSADDVIGAAKLIKTPDELGFLREALRITEQAIAPVQAALAPGVRQVDLTATFLGAAFDLGADANILDPIFQVMPSRLADGPYTTHGGIACPLVTTERELRQGDVLWVDTGLSYAGFASDFGRTWIVGAEPTPRQHAQFHTWRAILDAVLAVTRAGATGTDLTRAAREVAGDRTPWMQHFYLGHGLGIESAESPFIGTDLGDAYDERQVLAAGTVLVLEPLVWDDGAAGYRSEEVVVITDDGYLPLTDYPYDPYGD